MRTAAPPSRKIVSAKPSPVVKANPEGKGKSEEKFSHELNILELLSFIQRTVPTEAKGESEVLRKKHFRDFTQKFLCSEEQFNNLISKIARGAVAVIPSLQSWAEKAGIFYEDARVIHRCAGNMNSHTSSRNATREVRETQCNERLDICRRYNLADSEFYCLMNTSLQADGMYRVALGLYKRA